MERMTKKDWTMIAITLIPTLVAIISLAFFLGNKFSTLEGKIGTLEKGMETIQAEVI